MSRSINVQGIRPSFKWRNQMKFPDPNIGYVFGYNSHVTNEGIMVTFLGGLLKIVFRFDHIESLRREVYTGGRISWNVIRWGKCPSGTTALKVVLRNGMFRNHLIVFDRLEDSITDLQRHGMVVE
jgi:hypothetical protein